MMLPCSLLKQVDASPCVDMELSVPLALLYRRVWVIPKEKGKLRLETPAGLVQVSYTESWGKITSVKLRNIPSFLYKENLKVECPDLGTLFLDVAYGGNFYAIVDTQENFSDIEDLYSRRSDSMEPHYQVSDE